MGDHYTIQRTTYESGRPMARGTSWEGGKALVHIPAIASRKGRKPAGKQTGKAYLNVDVRRNCSTSTTIYQHRGVYVLAYDFKIGCILYF